MVNKMQTPNEYRILTLENDGPFYRNLMKQYREGTPMQVMTLINNAIKKVEVPLDVMANDECDREDRRWLPVAMYMLNWAADIVAQEAEDDILDDAITDMYAGRASHLIINPKPPTPKESTTMKSSILPAIVENRIYINEIDSKDLSDEVLFVQIADLEAEADKLGKIQTPSKKITERIEKLRKSAVQLADIVDAR